MTNTRITDPEVLEARFPVRLLRVFPAARLGRRRPAPRRRRRRARAQALAPLRVSIISERRRRAPFGLQGGSPGLVGRNSHEGNPLGGKVSFDVRQGERLRIETPGGGGFGRPAGPSSPR